MNAKRSFFQRAQMRQSPSVHARQSPPAKRAKSAQTFSCCSGMVVVENYPSESVCILKQGFQSGKTTIEIAMHGSSSYLVDFLSMSRIDLSDGSHRWIAWIDIHGKCFFPRVCCQENPSLDIKVDLRKPLQTGECEVIATNKNGKPTVVESESESALEQGSSDNLPGEDHSQLSDDAQFPECRTTAASVII